MKLYEMDAFGYKYRLNNKDNTYLNESTLYSVKDMVEYFIDTNENILDQYNEEIKEVEKQKSVLALELNDKRRKNKQERKRKIKDMEDYIRTTKYEIIPEIKKKIARLEFILRGGKQTKIVDKKNIEAFCLGKNIIDIKTIGEGNLKGEINDSRHIDGGFFFGCGSVEGSSHVKGNIDGSYIENVLVIFEYNPEYMIDRRLYSKIDYFGGNINDYVAYYYSFKDHDLDWYSDEDCEE